MDASISVTGGKAKIEIDDFQSTTEPNSFIAVLFIMENKKGHWQPIEFTLIHVNQRVPKRDKLKQRIWIIGFILNHWRNTLKEVNHISIIQKIDKQKVNQPKQIDSKRVEDNNIKFVGHFPLEFEFRENSGLIISSAQQEILALSG